MSVLPLEVPQEFLTIAQKQEKMGRPGPLEDHPYNGGDAAESRQETIGKGLGRQGDGYGVGCKEEEGGGLESHRGT